MMTLRKILISGILLVFLVIVTSCSGLFESDSSSGQIISPTVLVTLYVTPITATPLPVTPLPTSLPTPLPTNPPPPIVSDPNSPWNVPTYFPGIGCSASRLHVEDKAFVASTGTYSRIYATTNLIYDPGMRDLVPGEEMKIIEGPYCDEGWNIWKVEMDVDELEGWVAEGNGETYYLLPVVSPE